MVACPKWKLTLIAVILTAALVAVILGLTLGLLAPEERMSVKEKVSWESPYRFNSSLGQYRYAAVQTATHACSKIGTHILARQGGTAVDAAIATQFCSGLVLAYGSGIGGGLFMTIYQPPQNAAKKEMITIFAREVAPLAANKTMFVNRDVNASRVGGLAIGVPGEVAGLHAAWRRYGKLPWATLVEPAIRLLEEGVPIEGFLGRVIQDKETAVRDTPGLRSLFVKSDGTLRKAGELFWNNDLLRTLRMIADEPSSFYSGQLASDMVADIQDAGGVITEADFTQYRMRMKSPLETRLSSQTLKVYTPKPPSSGVVVQFILRLLEEFKLSKANIADLESTTLTYHRFIEALKFGFGKRSALGDEDFDDVTEVIAKMTSDEYIREIKRKITDNETHDTSFYEPAFSDTKDGGTNQIGIIAPDGSAVSLTSTINTRYEGMKSRGNDPHKIVCAKSAEGNTNTKFGSLVVGNRTGIIFNNQMDDFSTPNTVNTYGIPASASNFIAPGKMPMSSMSPSIVLDQEGNAVHITGASGGPAIISAITHVALHNLYLKQPLKTAVDTPRVHHQLLPDHLYYEKALPQGILDGLKEKGLTEHSSTEYVGIVAAIHNTCPKCGGMCDRTKCIHAVADGRKGGAPDGF